MEAYSPSPARPRPPSAGLLFSPEYVSIAFALAILDKEPGPAVVAARAAVAAIGSRLSTIAPGVSLVVHDVALPAERSGKTGSEPLRVEGAVEVDLPAGDVWERATRVAQVTSLLRGLAGDGRKAPFTCSFAAPVALVRDPERYRGEILSAWSTRTKELAAAAKEAGLTVAPLDAATPGPVVQHPLSLDQVELRLALPSLAPRVP
jgi:hypothetical protein